MDIQIFDHFEDDGQLTLFGLEDFDDLEAMGALREENGAEEAAAAKTAAKDPSKREAEGKASERETAAKDPSKREAAGKASVREAAEKKAAEQETAGREQIWAEPASDGIRIRSCGSCGKLLFVREEDGGYVSACNACGIQYVQR